MKLGDTIDITVILCYDWLLTLDMEVQFAWRAPKTSGVWLFLVNRYFTLLVVSSVSYSGNDMKVD